MGTTFAQLIGELLSYRDREFRSDPERDAARLDAIEYFLQTALEKLRDKLDPN
jgi:hypothetical protein